ncbi:MAG: CpsD/CapB family tyrosine-protein kinase [Candidatus Cloacimonadota bacterium]|nr:CpsD/CapB family tyrosine-protein kinase [Candidatus Cloacimonadota bacterium]
MNKIISKELIKNRTKTVLFTSSGESEGKTFVGVNLALNFVNNSPQRVLLVDMNLRNPQFHKIFKVPKESGVTDILNDKVHFEDTLKKTKHPNLTILTSGTYGGIVTQSFSDLQFVIEEIKSSFDLIILESSPLLVSNKNNIDPAILSSLIDTVILVVMARKTRKLSILKAIELVELSGGEIFGTVLNNRFAPQKHKKKGIIQQKGI